MKKKIFALMLVVVLVFSTSVVMFASTTEPNVQAYEYSMSYDVALEAATVANDAPQIINRVNGGYIEITPFCFGCFLLGMAICWGCT